MLEVSILNSFALFGGNAEFWTRCKLFQAFNSWPTSKKVYGSNPASSINTFSLFFTLSITEPKGWGGK